MDPTQYNNDGNTFTLVWTSPQANDSPSLAWADVDQDGDLDLVVQGYYDWGNPDRLYINQGTTLTPAWEYARHSYDTGLAWGDYDNDGYPDLVSPAHLFPNQNGQLGAPVLVGGGSGPTWGDWDRDGDLDLGSGREGAIYANNDGDFLQTWQFPYLSSGYYHGFGGLGFADWNLDFNLDAGLLHFYEGGPREMCIYASYSQVPQRIWCSPEFDRESVLAWGDFDGDGDPDLVTGSQMEQSYYNISNPYDFGTVRVYTNHANDAQALADTAPRVSVRIPGGGSTPSLTGNFATAVILQGPEIEIEYTLTDLESDPVRFIRAWFSLDGGSTWTPAVAAGDTITQNLSASPAGVTHTFTWDLFASGVSGSSDTTVFRIDAVQGFSGPGPYQYAYRWAASNPFRVRGSQVRVLLDGQPAPGAWVFRQPAGSSARFQPYTDLTGERLTTGPGGYLLGSSLFNPGDHLAALAYITGTHSYTLYYGSAAPTLTGIAPYTVTQQGVQVLEVSAANPLLLLNLDVSLEWDARYDAQFLSRLEYDFQRTSELLFDWSNGQIALGQVRIYHDRQRWAEAHIQIYASNRIRPNAAQGGITDDELDDPSAAGVVYVPGQVRIGAVWNRFGDTGGNLGEDWARSLAHELGHYALYLDDNYMGFDLAGRLIPIETCPGAMSDPYRDDYSEFHPADGWLPACEQTLSNQTTGRADWQTITAFYTALDSPSGSDALNPGPSGLPLAVTDLDFIAPPTPDTSLPIPLFYLSQDNHRLQPGSSARSWLFSANLSTLTDLGRPNLDQVLARGAAPGDRLCVFEPAANRLGCEIIQAGDEQLALNTLAADLPDVFLVAADAQDITVAVTNLEPGLAIWARLYPADGSPAVSTALTRIGENYVGDLVTTEPAPEGAVHVWVDEIVPRREIITDYALGGSPARMRGRMARMRGRMAPAISSDGQVILFGAALDFPEGEFYSLQALTATPNAPPWTTPVGQAYRLLASANAPAVSGASISFSYLGSEVLPGEENWLKIYYADESLDTGWQPLPTTLDPENNHAVASAPGYGLYVLMSSLEIPLYEAGWNLFSYPVQATRPITEGLLSISGYYTTVYGYDGADLLDHWKMYDVAAPTWVNDLSTLEFAHAYWIQTTQPITLGLRGVTPNAAAPLYIFDPPSTFYGSLLPGSGFIPAAGMSVETRIGGVLCGQAEALLVDAQVVYTINISAGGPGAEGCGQPGSLVDFVVAGQAMQPQGVWNNTSVQRLDLSPAPSVPLAADDVFETPEDESIVLDVLGNDSGEQLALLSVGQASHGIAIPLTSTILYTPTLHYFGSDSFTYTISALGGLTNTAQVTITITPVNDAPTIAALSDQAMQIGSILAGIPIVIADVDNLPADLHLSAESSSPAVIDPAQIEFSGTGLERSLSLEPQGVGQSQVTVTVSDGGLSASASFTLTVVPEDTYQLEINITGSGTVTRQPDKAAYHYGDVIRLTATPEPGWTFAGWSGAAAGSANPLDITISGNTTVSATFTQKEDPLQSVFLPLITWTVSPSPAAPPKMQPAASWQKIFLFLIQHRAPAPSVRRFPDPAVRAWWRSLG